MRLADSICHGGPVEGLEQDLTALDEGFRSLLGPGGVTGASGAYQPTTAHELGEPASDCRECFPLWEPQYTACNVHRDDTRIATPSVSVIVPFFETSVAVLDVLLQALDEQDYASDRVTAIFVDNNFVSSQFRPRPVSIRAIVIHSPNNIGSYAARNVGIDMSESDVLLFTDSDCLPKPSWMTEMVRAIVETDRCTIGGGALGITIRGRKVPTLVEDFDRRTHLRQADYLSRGFSATANLGACATVFKNVGSFSDRLLTGGDEEWCRRAGAMGFAVKSAVSAVVQHPARRKLKSVLIKNRRGCGGQFVKQEEPRHRAAILSIIAEFGGMRGRWNRLWTDGHPSTLPRRAGLVSMFLLVEVVRILEFIRLAAGGMPERR